MPLGTYQDFGNNRLKAEQWGKEHYEKWEQNLSPQQRVSIKEYTDKAVGSLINGYLRGSIDIQNQKYRDALDKQIFYLETGLASASIPKDGVILYRYTGVRELAVLKPGTNTYYTDDDLYANDTHTVFNATVVNAIQSKLMSNPSLIYRQFVSTSLVHDIDSFFSRKSSILFKIFADAQEHIAFLYKLSLSPEELEMLLSTGFQFKIKSVQQIFELGIAKLQVDIDLQQH